MTGRPPTRFRTHFVHAVLRLLAERGVDAAPLLRANAIPRDAAERPFVEVPLETLGSFLDAAATLLDDDTLGVTIAERLSRDTWDAMQLRCLAADDLGDGLQQCERLIRFFNAQVEITTRREGGAFVFEHRIPGHPTGLSRHGNELIVAVALARARQATERPLEPLGCWLAHERDRAPPALLAALGTDRLAFGTGVNAIRFRESDAALPLVSADPILRSVLDRLTESAERALSGRRGVAAQVLEQLLGGDRATLPSQPDVARRLALSVRSMQRALATEGTSFRQLLDQARRVRARELLARGVRVDDVAHHLGYAERSSFVRAYVRWAGTRPDAEPATVS